MDIDPFEIPPHVTGFGVDPLPHEVEARRQSFVSWVRALATALDSTVAELTLGDPMPSFDTVRLDRVDLWLLHNRFEPLVGVLTIAPAPGNAWAVAGEWVDLDLPEHVKGWGPTPLAANVLNAPIGNALDGLNIGAREQADSYKPQTIGNLIFNFWT